MCRLMAYIGPPALVADVVLWPARSIIKQACSTLLAMLSDWLVLNLSDGFW